MVERILVVDDEEYLRALISQVLRNEGHDVATAESGEAALEAFQQERFPIVVTDIFMGGMSGLDLLQEVKSQAPDTQVVVMTSNASLEAAMQALRSGAYDFLVKPFEDIDLISAVVGRASEKVELIEQNRRMVERLKENAEELERLNRQLMGLVTRDDLTGMYNRRHFDESLRLELLRSERHTHIFSLIYFDIDRFKIYNDTHGHPAGDDLLRKISELTSELMRATTVSARYGGEEFIILLPETDKAGARVCAERLRQNVEEYPFAGRESQPGGKVTLSIGVSSYPEDGTDCAALISCADQALYRAKESGRNRVFVWPSEKPS